MPVILDLREYAEFPAHTSLESTSGQIHSLREDVLSVGSVRLDLSIQKSGEEFFCQGKVSGVVTVECARCLKPIELQVSGGVDFIATTQMARDEQSREASDDEDYVIYDPNEMLVDLTTVVRQAFVLELPMKPICPGDCTGLQTPGGVRLKQESELKKPSETDPRWDGLKVFLKNTPEKGQN